MSILGLGMCVFFVFCFFDSFWVGHGNLPASHFFSHEGVGSIDPQGLRWPFTWWSQAGIV